MGNFCFSGDIPNQSRQSMMIEPLSHPCITQGNPMAIVQLASVVYRCCWH